MKKNIISLILTICLCMLPLTSTYAIVVQDPVLPNNANETIGKVLGAMQGVGMIMGTFIITLFGFKYLTAGAGEKAKTKDMLIPFMIGAFLVMAAPALVKWIWDMKG